MCLRSGSYNRPRRSFRRVTRSRIDDAMLARLLFVCGYIWIGKPCWNHNNYTRMHTSSENFGKIICRIDLCLRSGSYYRRRRSLRRVTRSRHLCTDDAMLARLLFVCGYIWIGKPCWDHNNHTRLHPSSENFAKQLAALICALGPGATIDRGGGSDE